MSGKARQARRFCFTTYWDCVYYLEIEATKENRVQYYVFGEETNPSNGNQHQQGYLETAKRMSWTAVAEMLGGAHVEICVAGAEANKKYCKEDGIVTEWGQQMQQGKRTDWKALKEAIVAGKSADDLCEEDPEHFHQYGRTIERLESIIANKKQRTEPTMITWLWGPTGTGKSKWIEDYLKANPTQTAYWHPVNDNKWWDGYKQQDIIILDDYRGELPFQELLKLADRYTHKVARRNKPPLVVTSKKIFITSCKRANDVYMNVCVDGERVEQLERRIEKTIHFHAPL